MVATSFLTASDASKEAYKTANLLKSLSVNALIGGEHGTGKTALACFILPEAPVFDARNFDVILAALPTTNVLIITHIEKSPNLTRLYDLLEEHKTRVVATTSNLMQIGDEFFSIRLQLPSLRERPEDVTLLQKKFIEEAKSIFGVNKDFESTAIVPDLSNNAYSLRRQITIHYLLSDINESELMGVMESFLIDKLGSNNDYRDFLHLYEVPLIRAGMKRFKSQLQLAERLGLNRNTLRKKIAEYDAFDLEI
ncbi:MAG: Fis family transcriptional regulator [Campylobacterales bacterium]|nr:Fis family transcriptional regulator [Campylobacterales bacterium]